MYAVSVLLVVWCQVLRRVLTLIGSTSRWCEIAELSWVAILELAYPQALHVISSTLLTMQMT